MNDLDNRLKDISEIRSMMERASKFLSLSGLAGVGAGTVALIGAGAAEWYLLSRTGNVTMSGLNAARDGDMQSFFVIDAIAVLIAAIGLSIFFSTRMARRKGLPLWNNTAKYVVAGLMIPLAAGGAFCVILLYHDLFSLIAGATLIFYGLALLNTSKFTVKELRYLGLTEMILGLLAALLVDYAVFIWALGFGVLHIMYGTLMYYKYEK